ncbi:MAG: response regulator [Actinomycetota bacterium]
MVLSKIGRPAEILLVEDNEADFFLAREAFHQINLAVNLHHVDQGQKCLAFLRKEDGYSSKPTPDLILLDINMPGMSGHEVLANLVADPALCHLPVVVMTTSTHEADVARMYSLRCNAYIPKPTDFDQMVKAFQRINDFWFDTVILPHSHFIATPLFAAR